MTQLTNEVKLKIEYGSYTEKFLQDILVDLTNEEQDQIEIDREFEPAEGIASEPITIAAIITATPVVATLIANAIERYFDLKRKKAEADLAEAKANLAKTEADLKRKEAELELKELEAKLRDDNRQKLLLKAEQINETTREKLDQLQAAYPDTITVHR